MLLDATPSPPLTQRMLRWSACALLFGGAGLGLLLLFPGPQCIVVGGREEPPWTIFGFGWSLIGIALIPYLKAGHAWARRAALLLCPWIALGPLVDALLGGTALMFYFPEVLLPSAAALLLVPVLLTLGRIERG